MCQLFETIKILDGSLCNIGLHNDRLNRSRRDVFGCTDAIDLRDFIEVPHDCTSGVVKCRVVYARVIDTIGFERYRKRDLHTLRLLDDDDIGYACKYCDRSAIDRLLARRDGCDDIIIVKGGTMTDSSFSNLVFDDGTRLLTPASPLLKGTKREQLLSEGMIIQEELRVTDMELFRSVHLINAMLDLNECTICVENIFKQALSR